MLEGGSGDILPGGSGWRHSFYSFFVWAGQVRKLQALVAPKPPQGVLVCGHAGRVMNKLSGDLKGCGPPTGVRSRLCR